MRAAETSQESGLSRIGEFNNVDFFVGAKADYAKWLSRQGMTANIEKPGRDRL